MDKDTLYNNLLIISLNSEVHIKKLLDLLFLLRNGDKADTKVVAGKLGLSKSSVYYIKKELGAYLTGDEKSFQIKKAHVESVSSLFDDNYRVEDLLSNFTPGRVALEFFKKRKNPDRQLDQFLATPETVMKRTALMDTLGDIKGKNIAFLGDDDFGSVATALKNKPRSISVLEIDLRITQSIDRVSENGKLEIKTLTYDARNDLPRNFKGNFDTVFTDPPYTINGVSLFLSRAVELLNLNNKNARIYFCYGNSDRAKERFIPIYQLIVNCGLMCRFIFDKFNRYEGAESIGSASSLFVCEATPLTKSIIKGNYDGKIYTFD